MMIGDTVLHSWEVLASILSSEKTLNILCDIGMCVPFFLFDFLLLSTRSPHARTSILNVPHAQAGDPQERDLQLPRDHPQPADPADPAKDVARE